MKRREFLKVSAVGAAATGAAAVDLPSVSVTSFVSPNATSISWVAVS